MVLQERLGVPQGIRRRQMRSSSLEGLNNIKDNQGLILHDKDAGTI
jgi:hypothetical protein